MAQRFCASNLIQEIQRPRCLSDPAAYNSHMKILILIFTLLTQPAIEITAEPDHHLTLENTQVRVFNVEVPSGTETHTHWHRHDYVYVAIGASTIVNSVEGKPQSTLQLADGETRFSPGPFAHAVRTVSQTPFRNITIEILQDEKLHHTPSPWKEIRGLDILDHGTKEILFVQDAIRATQFDLQPHAAAPIQTHPRPVLLIATADEELFLDDPRTHSPREPQAPLIHLKSGETTWLGNGFLHPIVNASDHTAKFITLEFP